MLGMPANCLRKYCVPVTAGAEPSVTCCQLPSEKFTANQSEAMEEVEENVFHCWVFMMG